jgi:uncharacterized protein involved in type VI secretion and phage assembly
MLNPPTLLEMLLDPKDYYKTEYRNGAWRAEVISTADPERRGRIQVRVFHLHPRPSAIQSLDGNSQITTMGVPDELCPWAEIATLMGGSQDVGMVMLPKVGATGWVVFEMGYTGSPVWIGGWYGCPKGVPELPAEVQNDIANKRVLKTPSGHTILFDDTSGAESITIRSQGGHTIELSDSPLNQIKIHTTGGSEIKIDATGELSITGISNASLTATGNVDINNAGTINLGVGAAQGVVLGPAMMTMFNTHSHGGVSGGNDFTLPPVPPMTPLQYSQTVKAKI